jgi:sigma-E factor negative regulatory protein RseA
MVMDGISALMDGELDAREGEREIARPKGDEALRSRWDEFHLVRDALRGEPILSSRFTEGLAKRLADEPTVLAPRRSLSKTRRVTAYAMSAAASVAAAALVAWVALTPVSQPVGPFVDNKAPLVAEQVVLPPQSEPSDGRMNGYLLAHEAFSPGSALQGLAPYIRTVTPIRASDRR